MSERDELNALRQEVARLRQLKSDLESSQMMLAEKNLALLEIKEELDEQKFKLAEANLSMLELTEQLREEQAKSMKLLQNILPERVIQDLNCQGYSEPECFESVTVFFSDLVDFTRQSHRLQPKVLLGELNDIFTGFDRIFTRHNCERIKTIGDAYLSVSGLPEADPEHWKNILLSALEAVDFLKKRNATSSIQWQMRIGIHSGSVTGGIVGTEKYIYDIFGDTVNTASRMEQNSLPMQINVSETTWRLANHAFCFRPRSPRHIKGKGIMQMYFLSGPLTP